MYRAGSAFIAVSPSFRGFQTKAAVEAKKLRPIKIPVEFDHKKLIIGQPKAVKVGVDADTGKADAKIAGTAAKARALGATRTTTKVDADTSAAHTRLNALQSRLRAMAAGRTLLQVGVVAAPLAIPAAAAGAGLLGGLGGIATAVGVGGGIAAALGLSQLKAAQDNQKAITTANDGRVAALNSVKSAEQAVADATQAAAATSLAATRAVADAQRSLADARRNAARVAQAAAEQVAAAERALVDAQERVRDSLRDLHDARQQALRDLADLQARTRANALETESADLALIAAREKLADAENNVLTSAEDMRAARLEVAEAEQRLSESRRQARRDAEDLARAERQGIDQSDPMVAAREQLAAARQDRADAQLELANARRSAAQSRADAARAVADAERNLARARADAASSQAQSAQQVAEAQEGLRDAQAGLADAEATRAEALAKLTPAQKRMLAGLASLTAAWRGFLKLVDRPLGGFMVSAMGALEKALPGLATFLRPVLRSLAGVMDLFGNAAASRGARRFARDFGEFAGVILRDAGRGTRNLVAGFGNLLRAFMPMSRSISKGLVDLTRRFRIWSANLKTSDGFRSFTAYVRREGPRLLGMFKAVGGALIAVGIALAPVASKLIDLVTGFATWTANLAENHPWLIRALSTVLLLGAGFGIVAKAVGAVLIPLLRFAGFVFTLIKWVKIVVFNLRFLWFVLRANPIGMVITVIGLLVTGLVLAYKKSETFRRIVNAAWAGIQKAVSWAWEKVIQPALKAMWWYISEVLFPVYRWLWSKVVKPVFGWIGDRIESVWEKVIRPAFTALRGFIGDTLPEAFRRGVDAIGRVWNGLQRLAAVPVNFLIGTVYNNGIRKLIGALPGVDTPNALPLVSWGSSYNGPKTGGRTSGGVQQFAAGGVLPGFTPGRDVHRFYSATGGRLDLSGGEAFMRPEWTRHVGRAGVDLLNGAARRGRRALANAMAAVSGRAQHRKFFLGGVMPLQGGVLTGTHALPYYGTGATFAGDINSAGDLANPPSLVKAWKSGVVAQRISRPDSYGNHYLVNHSGGTSSLYAHLSSFIAGVGQQLSAGQALGRVGATGNATGAHLHFEVRGGSADFAAGGRESRLARFADAIKAAGSFVKNVPGWFRELASMGGWGGLVRNMAGSVLGRFRGWANDKIPGPGPIPSRIFDNGGQLHQGYTLAYHGARKPDKVLTDAQWQAMYAVAQQRSDVARFDLYDVDGVLQGTIDGRVKAAQSNHDAWRGDLDAAGMGGSR